MFRITGLELEHIGPFGHLRLDLPSKPHGLEGKAEVHIFTGENGTGKTTILDALVASIKQDAYGLMSKFRSHGPLVTGPDFFGDNQKNDNNPKVSLSVQYNKDLPFVLRRSSKGDIVVSSENRIVRNFLDNINRPKSFAFFAYSGYRRLTQFNIKGISEIKENPLQGALDFQNSINPELLLQWIANTITKEALAKNQADNIAAERFRNALDNIERSIHSITGKNIHFTLNYEPISVNINVDGTLLDFNNLPDGLKSIVSWIADLLMRMDRMDWAENTPVFERNFILFLDEIEVHMHPAWQRKILPAVQTLFPNAQIFISTHSPFVIGSVDGAWIYKLVKPNGDSHLEDGYPLLSEDAKSVRYWLDEVFGVKEQFGPEVERDLKEFYQLKTILLKDAPSEAKEKFLKLGKNLATQSAEINQIIQMEIRQVNRLKSLELSIIQ